VVVRNTPVLGMVVRNMAVLGMVAHMERIIFLVSCYFQNAL
jgi:hypothetical protein